MFNRFSLGATILGIFLLAIFGIGRAFSWLTESPGNDNLADRSVPAESASGDGSFIQGTRTPSEQNSSRDGDRQIISQADSETISQSNGQSNGQSSDSLSEEVFAPTPLETAGTYIQRQKGSELDQIIANSDVEATLLATDGDVPSPDDTQNTQLDPTDSTDTGSTAPVSQSVPALW